MVTIEKARQTMQKLSVSVREFIQHYNEILGQIQTMKAENAELEAKIKELKRKS